MTRALSRNIRPQIPVPNGESFEQFRDATKNTVNAIIVAIDEIATNQTQRWEEMALSGTWTNSGSRNIAVRYLAPDTAVLRGNVTQATLGNIATTFMALPPGFRPRFATELMTHGFDGAARQLVVLSIATTGVVTPAWAATGAGPHVIKLDNCILRLD